jgi:putative oxidoreductase
MGGLVSVYPGGTAGLALLLLRISLAGEFLYLTLATSIVFPEWSFAVAGIVALGLAAGFWTRVWAGGLFMAAVGGLILLPPPLGPLIGLGGACSLALALLGPGTWSLDARLFGLRVISLNGGR